MQAFSFIQFQRGIWALSAAALCAGLAACSDPAADKPRAAVGPAAAVPADSSAASMPGASRARAGEPSEVATFAISPAKSRIGFVGSKVTGSHVGEFKRFEGQIAIAPGGPLESGQVRVEIDMGSVETDTSRLTSHLKTGDFFLVEQFPTALFESESLEPNSARSDTPEGGEPAATHTVRGSLTLRGVKKSISFPATIARDGDDIVVKSEFALNRKEFGIEYPGKPDDLIRDDVVISLDLRTSS